MGVPYTFSTASQSIPLAQLDSNFATPITLGQSTAFLGQTVTTITGLTLANVNITSGNVVANASGNITFGNTTVDLGNSSSSIGNLTLNNTIINSGNISSAVIPTANGTVMLSGNMPAFSAYMSSSQTISTGVSTKLAFDTKIFDTNTNYNTTNYRFTPTVAGYYQINFSGSAADSGAGGGVLYLYFYKNGSLYAQTRSRDDNGQARNLSMSTIILMNGSTDYVELYGLETGGTSVGFTGGGSIYNQFSGSLIRGS